MSDTSSRPVGGPPKRPAKAPASSLIKRNRPQPSFPAEPQTPEVESTTVAEPSRDAGETITPAAFPDRPEAPGVSTSTPTAGGEGTVPPQGVGGSGTPAASAVVEPAAAPAPAAVAPEQADALVNTTFRVRRSSKKAFDAAFLAAKLHEGWPSAEAYFQDLLERETKRIQDDYNNGQPFPIREKALPRGRPIGS